MAKNIVNIIKLVGTIKNGKKAGVNMERFRSVIDKAFTTGRKRPKLVVLYISSPGGSPAQSEEVAKYIVDKHKATRIPVISVATDMAASGGYWIALAGNQVFTLNNTLVGSIGVVASMFNFSDTIQRIGVQRKVLTIGEYKGGLDPFSPPSDDKEQEMKRLMADLAENFYNWVKERRGDKLQQAPEEIFNGRIWVGNKAAEIGLTDGVGTLEEVLKKQFPQGCTPKFFEPRTRSSIFSSMAASAGTAFATAIAGTVLARLGITETDEYNFH